MFTPREIKAAITPANFIAWLEQLPPDTPFIQVCTDRCVVAEWLRQTFNLSFVMVNSYMVYMTTAEKCIPVSLKLAGTFFEDFVFQFDQLVKPTKSSVLTLARSLSKSG